MTENGLPLSRATKLADRVYEYLVRQISTQAFPPGASLRELDLVAQLGVSRTPIREALVRLAENGIVRFAGRGAEVRQLNRDDVLNIYQVRRALEGEAVRLACGRLTSDDFARLDALVPAAGAEAAANFDEACFRLDVELHRTIALRSGNAILAREIQKLHDLIFLVHKCVADNRGQLTEQVRQHVQIIAALKSGDRKASRKVLLDHLRSSCQIQIRYVLAAARQPRGEAGGCSSGASFGS